MKPGVVETNFKVPKGCRHEWLLFYEDEFIGAISGVPGKKQIQHFNRDPLNCPPEHIGRLMSMNLDWMAESVEALRRICKK